MAPEATRRFAWLFRPRDTGSWYVLDGINADRGGGRHVPHGPCTQQDPQVPPRPQRELARPQPTTQSGGKARCTRVAGAAPRQSNAPDREGAAPTQRVRPQHARLALHVLDHDPEEDDDAATDGWGLWFTHWTAPHLRQARPLGTHTGTFRGIGASAGTSTGASATQGASVGLAARLRELLTCPITLELFDDPVVTPEGHTYERDVLEEWLDNSPSDPSTRKPLARSQLVPNNVARELARALKAHKEE